MDIIEKMIFTACLCGIAVSICDILKPDEKFSKQLHFILSLVFVTGILSPFAFLLKEVSDGSSEIMAESYDVTFLNEDTYIEYLEKITVDNIEKSLTELLENNGIKTDKTEVCIDISEDSCISIISIGLRCSDFEKAEAIIKSETGEECEIWKMN